MHRLNGGTNYWGGDCREKRTTEWEGQLSSHKDCLILELRQKLQIVLDMLFYLNKLIDFADFFFFFFLLYVTTRNEILLDRLIAERKRIAERKGLICMVRLFFLLKTHCKMYFLLKIVTYSWKGIKK